MSELSARVAAALSRIQNPRLDNDLLSAGMVRDLVVEDDGKVSLHLLAGPGGSRDAGPGGPRRGSQPSRA